MGETPKSCINGSSATKPLTRKTWGTLNDYPLDAKASTGVRRKCMAWVRTP